MLQLYEQFLNERKISNLIKSIISKISKKIKTYSEFTIELIKKKGSNKLYYGKRIYDGSGKSFRLVSDDKKFKNIIEIDFFTLKSKIPVLTMNVSNISDYDNIIKETLPKISDNLKIKNSLNEGLFSFNRKDVKVEKPKVEKTKIQNEPNPKLSDTSEDINLEEIFKGDKTDVHVLETLKMLAAYSDMVIEGGSNSLIAAGRAGIGKSHEVLKRFYLKNMKPKKDFVIIKGKTTPLGLFTALYQYSDKIIVFDDCDAVFDTKGVAGQDKQNILKAALDSYPTRTVTWRTSKEIKLEGKIIPQSFNFTGKCIFITNLPVASLDKALLSRSLVHEVVASDEDVILQLKHIIPNLYPEIDLNIKYDALKVIVDLNKNDSDINLNLRTLIKAIVIRNTNHPLWETMTKFQCKNIE